MEEFKEVARKWGDGIAAVALLAILLVLIKLAPYFPDNAPDKIRNRLAAEGYDVRQIEFVRTEKNGVYRSSEPILLDSGEMVAYWSFFDSTRTGVLYSVTPYYETPEMKPTKVTLKINHDVFVTIEDASALAGVSVEEYIKSVVAEQAEKDIRKP